MPTIEMPTNLRPSYYATHEEKNPTIRLQHVVLLFYPELAGEALTTKTLRQITSLDIFDSDEITHGFVSAVHDALTHMDVLGNVRQLLPGRWWVDDETDHDARERAAIDHEPPSVYDSAPQRCRLGGGRVAMALTWRQALSTLICMDDLVYLGHISTHHRTDVAHGVTRPSHNGPLTFQQMGDLGPRNRREFAVHRHRVVHVQCGCPMVAAWDIAEDLNLYATLDSLRDAGWGLDDDCDDVTLLHPPNVWE